ncbi:MAG TPA: DNA cytosine methyltransferase [Phycisphaerae bacterium]|nr:DNA cytosine methyltransferase [Phycisphaerae bacterium]HUU90049.1 DNA cytosine methyltransferase [Phycisphaerae bacterium]
MIAYKHFGTTVVDLFAGAGLFSHAFAAEGFALVKAFERDKVAAATYAMNLGDHVQCADVLACRPEGKCDVLIAGPPCQGFSTLGKRNAADPRNCLSLEVVRWGKAVGPKVVVIENVPAFVGSSVWQQVVSEFEQMGYVVRAFVVDAYEMGTPQFRTRSFTIASVVGMPVISRALDEGARTVREAWRGLPAVPDGKNHHYSPKPSPLALARMRVIPVGGDKRDVMRRAPELAPPSWWKVQSEVTDAWGRMEWDRPCNTLRTALQNASKGRYIHPQQNRVISLREAARLHTIPEEWKFAGTPTQIARQIGNSVPPALGRAVARSVRQALG